MTPRLPDAEAYILDTFLNYPQRIDPFGCPMPNNLRILIDTAPDFFTISQLVAAAQTLFLMQYIFDIDHRVDQMNGRIVVTPAGAHILKLYQAQQPGTTPEKPAEPGEPKTDIPDAFRDFGSMEVD